VNADDTIAWIDESGSNSSLDPGTYIMAAAITFGTQVDPLRDLMRALRLPGQGKVHWRDEQASRHARITAAIAAADVEHLVVVTSPHKDSECAERRRRLTLQFLLPELASLGVDMAYFESRGDADDRRDRKMLDYLRSQRILSSSLRIDHLVGRGEPALWVPDALCGIVSSMRCGKSRYFESIEHKVTLMEYDMT